MTEATLAGGRPARVWYLDRLRALACLAVVLIHCFVTLLDNSTISAVGVGRALAWTEVLVVLSRWAVPIFLMITGALLLDPGREVGWLKVRSYVGRMAGVLLTFGTLFALMEVVFDARFFSLSMVPEALLRVLQGSGWAHLWYLYDLLGVYLLLPVLRAFVASADKHSYATLLAVLFALCLAVPTVNAATGLSIETLVWVGNSVFYVLLGRYLATWGAPLRPALVLGAAGTLAAAVIAAAGILVVDGYLSWVWLPPSPLVALQAAAVFLAARRWLDVPFPVSGVTAALASLSFPVYVLHPVMANLLYKALGWSPSALPPVLFEAATFVAVLGGALVLAALCRRLPIVGRLL